MKLLSPSEGIARSKARLEGEKQKAVRTQTLIAQKYREVAEAEKAFNDALLRQRAQWDKEQQDQIAIITPLREEVVALERRREEALIPLTTRALELDTIESQLKKRKETLDTFESNLIETEQELSQRLDEVADREVTAGQLAITLKLQKQDNDKRAIDIQEQSGILSASFANMTSELIQREQEVQRKEISLEARIIQVQEAEKRVANTIDEINRRDRALKDERATLDRIAKELQTKK